MLNKWLEAFIDIFYPPKCPACKVDVVRHGEWCLTCTERLVKPRYISPKLHQLKYLDGCFALCEYTGSLQRLLRDMKFRAEINNSRYLTELLVANYAKLNIEGFEDVIPVPLSKNRLQERGFNQVELIFEPWSKQLNFKWDTPLMRIKDTKPQWELKLKERKGNIKSAFSLTRSNFIINRHILLVDDIITTGITMDECAKVLKTHGAKSVVGLALASNAELY